MISKLIDILFSVFLYYRHNFYQVTIFTLIVVLVTFFEFAYDKNKSLNEEIKEKNATIDSLKKTIKELEDSSNQAQIEYSGSGVLLKASGLNDKGLENINATIRSLSDT